MEEKDNKEYELAVLVKTEEDLAPVMAFVRQHNAEITAEPRAKKLALAYEIKKHKEAVFAYCTFKASSADIKTLEIELNTKAEVIRSLILASPAPAMVLERDRTPYPGAKPRTRVTRSASPAAESRPAPSQPLSNEALEKKIEEILQ